MAENNSTEELPKRKTIRLANYDYGRPGVYFITLCTRDKRCILSDVVYDDGLPHDFEDGGEYFTPERYVKYKVHGEVVRRNLLALEERYADLTIDSFVIMPNHLHAIVYLRGVAATADGRRSLTDIVCAFKSLVSRECRAMGIEDKIFQRSFFDRIIRNGEEYDVRKNYINCNPRNWHFDDMYTKD